MINFTLLNYDENSATLSPDIIKMVIKSHKAYEYITKISTQDYPFLFTVYSLKKLTGNNFDDLIDSFLKNINPSVIYNFINR